MSSQHITAQCQTSTQKLTDRYLVNFGFEGIIWATLTREKKYFPICSSINMKNFGAKLEKLHFYVVILAMFKFTVIMPITAKMETVLRLLWTYKIILKRKNHRNTMVQFYYIGADFLVLRESRGFLKQLCTASDNVHH